jgi:predicted membrane-bound spermidine synthase
MFDAPGRLLSFVALYVALPASLVGPPTFLMGFSFPFLQKAAQPDLNRLGRRLGVLLASNIAGAVAGALLTGWILLPVAGTPGALRALAALSMLLSWPLARLVSGTTWRRTAPLGAAALTLAAIAAVPPGDRLWARLHGSTVDATIVAEDGTGLSLLKLDPSGADRRVVVFTNGLGQSEIPFGGVHTELGALPTLLHPSPRAVLIVGLGSGDTAYSAASRPESRVTCVEIVGAQLATLARLAARRDEPAIESLLRHPRITHVVGDGRAHLLRTGARFDVIELDALRPTSAYAGHLYSREFFRLMKDRLTPGGFAVSWAPTARARRTFLAVFPHVLDMDTLLVGSNQPIAVDAAALAERARAARAHFAAAGVDLMALVRPYLSAPGELSGPGDPRGGADLNSDLFPRDEFALPE